MQKIGKMGYEVKPWGVLVLWLAFDEDRGVGKPIEVWPDDLRVALVEGETTLRGVHGDVLEITRDGDFITLASRDKGSQTVSLSGLMARLNLQFFENLSKR